MITIQPFLEITGVDWDLAFDINCKGVLWCSEAAARRMIAQGRGGKIINIASQAGRRGEDLVLTYCASKAVVISMTQSIALALAELTLRRDPPPGFQGTASCRSSGAGEASFRRAPPRGDPESA